MCHKVGCGPYKCRPSMNNLQTDSEAINGDYLSSSESEINSLTKSRKIFTSNELDNEFILGNTDVLLRTKVPTIKDASLTYTMNRFPFSVEELITL